MTSFTNNTIKFNYTLNNGASSTISIIKHRNRCQIGGSFYFDKDVNVSEIIGYIQNESFYPRNSTYIMGCIPSTGFAFGIYINSTDGHISFNKTIEAKQYIVISGTYISKL